MRRHKTVNSHRHLTAIQIYAAMLISILVFEMALFDVALKITNLKPRSRSQSFFIDLTRRFPSASVFIWCNRENDVIEIVVRNPEEYPLVVEEIHTRAIEDVIEEITDDSIILYAAKKPIFVIDAYTKRIMNRIGYKEKTYEELQNLFMNNLELDEKLFNE